MLKMLALGALGYAGYRYFQKNQGNFKLSTGGGSTGRGATSGTQSYTGTEPDVSDPQVALAGGPLSSEASLRHSGQSLPVT